MFIASLNFMKTSLNFVLNVGLFPQTCLSVATYLQTKLNLRYPTSSLKLYYVHVEMLLRCISDLELVENFTLCIL